MATIKKSKKKIVIPICIILVIAIVASSVAVVAKKNSGEEVSINTIATGDIYEKVSLTGEVSSGTRKEYKVGTVATVKEVFVSVGDEVKKGDTLVSFDVTQLNSQVASMQASYDSAKKSYNDAVANQKISKKKAAAIKKQIKETKKTISKLEKIVEPTTKATTVRTTTAATTTAHQTTTKKDIVSSILASTTTTAPTTTTTTQPDTSPKYTVSLSTYPSSVYGSVSGAGRYPVTNSTVTIKAVANPGYEFLGWYKSRASFLNNESPVSNLSVWEAPLTGDISYIAVFTESSDPNNTTASTASVTDIVNTLKTLNENIASITKDVQTMTTLIQLVATSISGAVASGQLSSEYIAKLVGDEVSKAIKEGIVDSTKFIVESGVAVDMIQAAVASIDYQALAKGVADSNNAQLTSAELQLASLNVQYELYKAESDDSIVDANRTAMNSTKKALDILKQQQQEMANGWKADFDGVITSLDVTPGADTSMISTGLVLENLDKLVVNVSLGEYDVHKVKVGMNCKVTTAYGEYDGVVATIAPTATGGSSGSILDSVGSMAGISGLSSLTDSGAGVECTIEVLEPDDNIIAGFDADVEIQTGEFLGVTVVPIESIVLEKTGSYVYLYNEEDSTVTKTQIKTGAISDSSYQVTEGIKPGDRIVATPSTDFKDDTFKVKVVESKGNKK